MSHTHMRAVALLTPMAAINVPEHHALTSDNLGSCRVVLKDAVKTHSIQADVDTAYEDFVAELKSKAEEQIQEVAEPMR